MLRVYQIPPLRGYSWRYVFDAPLWASSSRSPGRQVKVVSGSFSDKQDEKIRGEWFHGGVTAVSIPVRLRAEVQVSTSARTKCEMRDQHGRRPDPSATGTSVLPPLSTMNTNTSPLDADREVILQVRFVHPSSPVPQNLNAHVCYKIGRSREFFL